MRGILVLLLLTTFVLAPAAAADHPGDVYLCIDPAGPGVYVSTTDCASGTLDPVEVLP